MICIANPGVSTTVRRKVTPSSLRVCVAEVTEVVRGMRSPGAVYGTPWNNSLLKSVFTNVLFPVPLSPAMML